MIEISRLNCTCIRGIKCINCPGDVINCKPEYIILLFSSLLLSHKP
ncbi:unnamed protein product [Schistosoma mattheei]|uniref:Uncharacterized protein n=1 Tax=Schistosoma mattheei TaxID=31246 RepID=A0A3P8B8P0_9TREM|nr:unnamed protein product [Schistosoma mattheei]